MGDAVLYFGGDLVSAIEKIEAMGCDVCCVVSHDTSHAIRVTVRSQYASDVLALGVIRGEFVADIAGVARS